MAQRIVPQNINDRDIISISTTVAVLLPTVSHSQQLNPTTETQTLQGGNIKLPGLVV